MHIMTILGTRPEIIRLSQVIKKLDSLCQHTIVHTGQNFDFNLKDVFFEQLGVREPDHYLGAKGTLGQQLATLLSASEDLMRRLRPDRLLLLGDTNSALSAIIAKRLAIPVYHMEAGNRCYDDRVPEEVNRRIIDHCSDILMPYTERSRQNLLREGIPSYRVFVTGNPIYEVIRVHEEQIAQSEILDRLGLTEGKFFLVTMHRAENVDVPDRLNKLVSGLDWLQREYNEPVIISTHPRTRARLEELGVQPDNPELRYLEPFSFFDFIMLERKAHCVLTDSGTVQEECAIFNVPNVTIRDVTERPETVECGSNILSGAEPEVLSACVRKALKRPGKVAAPSEYLVENVSDTVVNIVLSYHQAQRM
ncbi:MAG: UDP-N-acetyl glucosamine 2-epimerase [Gemmatales bacterium]|nr:MAG: UDP-N-acetyl glucosamine 2-epimerase [Gemmatales bacterium]